MFWPEISKFMSRVSHHAWWPWWQSYCFFLNNFIHPSFLSVKNCLNHDWHSIHRFPQYQNLVYKVSVVYPKGSLIYLMHIVFWMSRWSRELREWYWWEQYAQLLWVQAGEPIRRWGKSNKCCSKSNINLTSRNSSLIL